MYPLFIIRRVFAALPLIDVKDDGDIRRHQSDCDDDADDGRGIEESEHLSPL